MKHDFVGSCLPASVASTLGCQLLSNSNLILGVQYTVTLIFYCGYCVYCYFLSIRGVTVCPLGGGLKEGECNHKTVNWLLHYCKLYVVRR
jgi:hypothetical protein